MQIETAMLFLLLGSLLGVESYSYWDNCSFVYESHPQPGFCSPLNAENTKNASLNLPCGFPLTAPLTGHCKCDNNAVLAFCPQNVKDPFKFVPYERSCRQLCEGTFNPQNKLAEDPLSNHSAWQLGSVFSSPTFGENMPPRSNVTACDGICLLSFSATFDATGITASNLEYEFRFAAYTANPLGASTASFCPPAYRADVRQDCFVVDLLPSPSWQSYVVASGALNNPGTGPFTPNLINIKSGFSFLLQTTGKVFVDELRLQLYPAIPQQTLILNQFNSAAPANKPEASSQISPMSLFDTDLTPALIIGNSSEHDVDIFYCRALFYDVPNSTRFTTSNLASFYSDFQLSSWEASNYYVNVPQQTGVSNGIYTLTADEIFPNYNVTPGNTASCVPPGNIFNETNSYQGWTTLCHSSACGECLDMAYDYDGIHPIPRYYGAWTFANISVATCQPNYYGYCHNLSGSLYTFSSRVNPKQDNTLNVTQRSGYVGTKPFSVPHPLRSLSPIKNENYVYIGLQNRFRLRRSDFLGFYSPSVRTQGQSLGFAALFDPTQNRTDSKFSVLRKSQANDVSVQVVNKGIGLQCFGEHVLSTKCSVGNGGCHPKMTCTNGFSGARNILCSAQFDDPSICAGVGCPNPLYDFPLPQDNARAKSFDAFQCEVMCSLCARGWIDNPRTGLPIYRPSPRGEPPNAETALQKLDPTFPLCFPCPNVTLAYTPTVMCSGHGDCQMRVIDIPTQTLGSVCNCDQDSVSNHPLWVGTLCEIPAAVACNFASGNLGGGFVKTYSQQSPTWVCQCNDGYDNSSRCFTCSPGSYSQANSNNLCLKCDNSTCKAPYGSCMNGLTAMPWGGGCFLNEGVRATPGASFPTFECVPSFPGLIITQPSCSICNPELTCNGQGCNTNLSTPGSGACICDDVHTLASNCSSCRAGYYGPDCLPCPSTCQSPGGTCTGSVSSAPCTCNPSYRGSYCQYSDLITCNGHGTVTDNGICACRQDLGWSGTYCDECAEANDWWLVNGNCQKCTGTTCNGHGVCTNGYCSCDSGFDPATNCSTCLSTQFPLGVCKAVCTNATCNNRGTCDANGQCVCSANFTGRNCEKCAEGYWLNGASCVECLGVPPCGGSNIGICSTNGTCQCIGNYHGAGCVDPVITGIDIVGRKMYVFGAFLPSLGYVKLGGTGTVNCTIVSLTDHLDCDCPFLTPDGTWSYSVQVFVSDGRSSQVFTQPAALPIITGSSANPIPTTGGVDVTIMGSNFGLVGGKAVVTDTSGAVSNVTLSQQNDTQIVFSAGPGAGVSTVRVKVGNTVSQNAVSMFYLPPTVTSISAGGATTGQTNVVIQGQNFGLNPSLASVVFENGASCIINSNCSFSHAQFCCSAPPGFGKMKVSLTIASVASVELLPQYYLYGAPQISSVRGCPVTASNGTANCEPAGGTRVTINGTNFGDVLSFPGVGSLAVSIDGAPCSSLSLLVPHFSLSCVLPPGIGISKAVQVSRTGRFSQVGTASLVSYLGPTLTPSTIKLAAAAGASTGVVVDNTTQGGRMISIVGQGFSANLQVRYGPAASGAMGTTGWQDCVVNMVTQTAFNCTTAPGVGKNLVFRATLQVAGSYYSSDLSVDTYSYPPPTLTSGSLGNSFLSRSISFTSQVADGELIYMSGTFLGKQPSLVKVFYGPKNYPCVVQTVNETELTCITSIGSGAGHTFRVEVGYGSSAQFANGTDQFSYPAVPSIASVTAQGCGSPPSECPTEAMDSNGLQISMIIGGSNLGRVYRVLVGDQVCNQVQVSNTVLLCRLPKGVGVNKQVVLLSPRSRVTAATTISYAPPIVYRVSGCTDISAGTVNCARTGVMITVRGANFGLMGARVLVGGSECTGVVHNGSTTLTCVAPAAPSSLQLVVNVLQSGQMSSSLARVAYMPCPPGSEERSGLCVQCNIGWFSLGSQCTACALGSVAPAGASSCTLCEMGKFSIQNASICSNCAAGRSTGAPAQSECEDCPAGRYSFAGGPCGACPLGSYQDNITAACSLALPGFAASGTQTSLVPSLTQLVSCSYGTFSLSSGVFVCNLCAPGKFSAGNINQTGCTDCGPGRFQQSAGQSSCTSCPEGSFSLTGSTRCRFCAAGRFGSVFGAGTACMSCYSGMYAPIPGLRDCLSCPRGKYGNVTGLVVCPDCPAGRFNNNSMQTTCMACPSMSFSDFGATACTRCDFQNFTGQSACAGCEPGKYATPNMTCVACAAGRVTSFAGQTRCESCVTGRYTSSIGASVCDFCPSGYFPNTTTACTMCPPGTEAYPGQSICSNCVPGKFAIVGSSGCVLCSPGKYNVFPRATACLQCESGTFSMLPGAQSCLPCGPGKSTEARGASFCNACVPGKYARGGTGEACVSCAFGQTYTFSGFCVVRGTHAPRYGASLCLPCPFLTCSGWDTITMPSDGNGSTYFDTSRCFSVDPSAGNANYCGAGFYAVEYKLVANSLGATTDTCLPCAPGKFTAQGLLVSARTCDSCPSGSVNVGSNTTGICAQCQPGKYSDGISCLTCASGKISSYYGLTSCTACAAGRFTLNFTGCIACPAGTFSTQDPQFQVKCENCVTGRYTSQPGQVVCRAAENGYRVANSSNATRLVECPAGTFHLLDEGVYLVGFFPEPCLPCPPGFFSEIGATVCLPCPPGYFGNTNGSSSCSRCLAGSTSIAQSRSCTLCANGTYASEDGASCRSCLVGKFINSSSLTCLDCPPGRAQSQLAQQSCTLCEPGHFAFEWGSAACTRCRSGRFQSAQGQVECLNCTEGSSSVAPYINCSSCPSGRFSTSPEDGCEICPAGRFSNSLFPQNCTLCDPGTSSTPESPECAQCSPGKYQPHPDSDNCLECPAGTVSTDSRLECSSCEPGKVVKSDIQQCVPCRAGFSAVDANSTVCNPCQINEATLSIDNATFCYPCVQNALPEPQNVSCQCIRGYYQGFTTHNLSRPENLLNGSGDLCNKCPDGMNCGSQRVSFNTATAKPGYWCERARNQTDPIYYECRVWSYCLGGANCECADNRAGVLCSVCRPGFHVLPDNSCAECPSTAALSLTYVLGVSIAVLVLMSIVYAGVLADDRFLMVEIKKQFLSQRKMTTRQPSQISTFEVAKDPAKDPANEFLGNEEDLAISDARSPVTSRTQQAFLYKRRPKLMGQLKIILGFFQITSHLTRALAVPWPTTYLAFMSFFSVARIDLLSVIPASCIGQLDYYDEFTFVALLPLLILAFMTCTYLLPRLAKDKWCSSVTPEERRTKIDTLIIKWKKLCLFTLFAIYPTISVNAAQLFICVDIVRSDKSRVSYLAKDVNLVCETDQWEKYAAWGVVSLLVYSAGIPLFFFLLLLRNKPNFSENKIRYQLGFVYEAYAPNIWFFEIVDMCHKFLLTCFIFLVGASSQVQLILGMLFCMTYLVVILLGNPYLRPTDDRLHKLAQVLIFLLLLAALNKQQAQNLRVSRTSDQMSIDEVLGSTFLITVTVGFLLVLLYQVLYVLRVGIKRVLTRVRNKQEERNPTLTRRSTGRDFSQSQAEEVDEVEEVDANKPKEEDLGHDEEG